MGILKESAQEMFSILIVSSARLYSFRDKEFRKRVSEAIRDAVKGK